MIIFTDGGCINNGKSNAKASYAVFIDNYIVRGHVMPYEYIYENDVLLCNDTPVNPTNNRGELLSIIRAFIEILNKDGINFIVYSDSQICVKTINEWYENRQKKGTIHEFKNLDLIEIMMELYKKIKQEKNIKIIHTRGHQKITSNMSELEKKIISGNDIVDKHASDILHINTYIDYEIINNVIFS